LQYLLHSFILTEINKHFNSAEITLAFHGIQFVLFTVFFNVTESTF